MIGLAGFERHVEERLRMGVVEYGDRSYGRPLAELLTEQARRPLTLPPGERIAASVLERRPDLEGFEVEATRWCFARPSSRSRLAWRQLDDARLIVREADREASA